ncbi:hypothetical protein CL634_07640 [bacterium]|nr:hypothetical protein [bacterium]
MASWQFLTALGAAGRAGSEIIDKRQAMHDLDTREKARDAYERGREELDKRKLKRQTASERLDFLETLGITGRGAAALIRSPAHRWEKQVERLLALSSEMPKTVSGVVGEIPPDLDSPILGDQTAQALLGPVQLTQTQRMAHFGITSTGEDFIDPALLPDDWKEKILDDFMGQLPPQGLTQEDETDIRTSFVDRFFGPTVSDPSEAIETAAERLGISVDRYKAIMGDTFTRLPIEDVTYARVQTAAEKQEAQTAAEALEAAENNNALARRRLEQDEALDEPASEGARTYLDVIRNADGNLVTVERVYPPMSKRELQVRLDQDKTHLQNMVNRTNIEAHLRDEGKVSRGQQSVSQGLASSFVGPLLDIETRVDEWGNLIPKVLGERISTLGDTMTTNFAAASNLHFKNYPAATLSTAHAHLSQNRNLLERMSIVRILEEFSIPAYNIANPAKTPLTLNDLLNFKKLSDFALILGTVGLDSELGPKFTKHLLDYYTADDDERTQWNSEYRTLVGPFVAERYMPASQLQESGVSGAGRTVSLHAQLGLGLTENFFGQDNYPTRAEQLRAIYSEYTNPYGPNSLKNPNYIENKGIRDQVVALLENINTTTRTSLVSRDELKELFRTIIAPEAAGPVMPAILPAVAGGEVSGGLAFASELGAGPPSAVEQARAAALGTRPAAAAPIAPAATPTAPALATTGLGGRPAGADAADADAVADADADAAGEVGEPPKLYPADHSPPGFLDFGDKERWGRNSANWKAGGEAPSAGTDAWWKVSNYYRWKAANEQQEIFETLFHEAHDTFSASEIVTSMQADENLTPERARNTIRDQFIRPLIRRLQKEGRLERLPSVWNDVRNKLTDILYQTYVTGS